MFRIRIRFLRIRILDFSPDPDPGNKNKIFKGKNKILGEIFVLNPKSRYFFLFSTNQVGILLNRELLFDINLKISENHKKIYDKSWFL